MPVTEAGFIDKDNRADVEQLIHLGPTLEVTVRHMDAGEETPEHNEQVYALIDTGATTSCIDQDLAEKLELPVVDEQTISGAGGPATHPVYMAHIDIPALDQCEYGRFTGVKLADGEQAHAVLLGRTFLNGVIMIYDGLRAQVTLSGNVLI